MRKYRIQQKVSEKKNELTALQFHQKTFGIFKGSIMYMVHEEDDKAIRRGLTFSERLDLALDIVYLNLK